MAFHLLDCFPQLEKGQTEDSQMHKSPQLPRLCDDDL